MLTLPALELVRESKIGDLLPTPAPTNRWEASGVLVKDDYCFIVFDNRTEVGRFSMDFSLNPNNGLFGIAHAKLGYECIAYNPVKQRYYLLIEARRHARDCYQAVVVEYDDEFNYRKERTLDFTFQSDNKGFEAIAHVRRNDQDYVLALCEGNNCKCGSKGRKPGGGRVQVFVKRKTRWAHTDTIPLPPSLPFIDYSGMSIDHGRVAIVSQVNSMLWVGQFDEASWAWRDLGRLYDFPRTTHGSILYGNIEGVSWLTPARILTVSDRRKKNQSGDELSEKDQSVHIFDIPSPDASAIQAGDAK